MATEPFENALALLISRELPLARHDPDRLSAITERLTHALAVTIAIGSGGDAARASTIIEGTRNYLDETVADLLPIGRLVRGG